MGTSGTRERWSVMTTPLRWTPYRGADSALNAARPTAKRWSPDSYDGAFVTTHAAPANHSANGQVARTTSLLRGGRAALATDKSLPPYDTCDANHGRMFSRPTTRRCPERVRLCRGKDGATSTAVVKPCERRARIQGAYAGRAERPQLRAKV